MSEASVTVVNTVAAVVVQNLTSGTTASVEIPAEQVVVVVEQVGIPGPPGPAGGATRTAQAGSTVSGHRALVEMNDGSVEHADATTHDHAHRVVGISSNAASEGGFVTVVAHGRIVEAALNLSPGLPVFVGADGALVQAPPATGFILQVGVATATDILQVRISRPIIRS